MNFIFKIIVVLILFVSPFTSFSQIEYDSTIKARYDSFYNKLPLWALHANNYHGSSELVLPFP